VTRAASGARKTAPPRAARRLRRFETLLRAERLRLLRFLEAWPPVSVEPGETQSQHLAEAAALGRIYQGTYGRCERCGLGRLLLRAGHETWMLMSGLIALCALIVVAVIVLPVFGPRVAAVTAGVLVSAIVLVCYLICVPGALESSASSRLRGGPRRDA